MRLQRAQRFRKYYKSQVLGLIYMAIVNAYIIQKAYHKAKISKPLTHVKFLKRLHILLCQLVLSDMVEGNTFGTDSSSAKGHALLTELASTDRTDHTVHLIDKWRDIERNPSAAATRARSVRFYAAAPPRAEQSSHS